MTDEQRRADAAAKKRAYRQRKREELARQAPKEEQERLFNEQFRNLTPEEIEARKRDDQARMQDFRRIAQATPNPLSKEQQEQAIRAILDANPAIIVTDKSNLHELEEQFRKAKGNSEIRPFPPGVLYQDRREQTQAIIADAEERHRRVELIMSNYQKDAANTNALLWHILETFTLMRLELIDLIGSLRK